MTKISQRREIADAGRKAAPVEHSALGSVQLDRIAAAGGPSSGGYGGGGTLCAAELDRIAAAGGPASGGVGGGGNAVWPPPPGRN